MEETIEEPAETTPPANAHEPEDGEARHEDLDPAEKAAEVKGGAARLRF
jgi:hypothetical protein